jgi:hypothetical protein
MEPRWRPAPPGPAPGRRPLPAPAAGGSCRCRCGRTARGRQRAGRRQVLRAPRRERPCSRLQLARAKADLVQHQASEPERWPPRQQYTSGRQSRGFVGDPCVSRWRRCCAPPSPRPLARLQGRVLHIQRADDARSFVVEHRPVDGAGQVVLGELGRRAGVDDGVEAGRGRLAAGECGGSGLAGHGQRGGATASSSSLSMLQLRAGLLQRRAVDQEGVFDPFAERGDLGQLQVDMVAGQHAGDGVEQAGAVAGADREQPALGALVGRAATRAA